MLYALTMMRPFSRTAIFSLIALGALSLAPCAHAQQVETAEAAKRRMAARDARQLVQEARLAYKAKRYSQAVEHYRDALLTLPDSTDNAKFAEFIRLSLSDALIAKAMDYRTVGRYDEAISFLQEAIKLAPNNKRAEQELIYTSDPVRHNPALTPQHVGDVAEVTRLLELGYGQIDLGKFDDAEETFRSILKIDPYNTAAQQGMESARVQKSHYYKVSRNSTRAKMLSDVDAQWEESVTGGAPVDRSAEDTISPGIDDELQAEYAGRLAEMVLPTIIFDDAPITDVVEALQNQITRFESNGVRAGRHINLTTNFGTADSPAYKELMSQTVRLNLSEVSVKEVLDLLVKQFGISYYYTPTGVELTYSGKDFGPLIERTFNVPPHFFDPRKDESDEDDEEEGFEDSSSRMAVHRVNPVQVLKSQGISFPEGATARYSSSTRRLVVRNTAHNLEDIQDLLSVPLEEERQIVLNVIVMEVAEDDLHQLGFDWLLNVSLGGNEAYMSGGQELTSTATGVPVFEGFLGAQGAQRSPSITSGLRSGKSVLSTGSAALENLISAGSVVGFNGTHSSVSPGIFGIRGVWKSVDVTMMMRGLAQRKGVDILHNPRLIFSPGAEEQVVFANVNELFFPETWEAPEIMSMSSGGGYNNNNERNSSSRSMTTTGATPSDFVRFGMTEDAIGGIGTILQVHSAEISENGRFVTLALTATTNEFEGFINWGTPISSAIWAGNGGEISFIELSPNYILQPMIKRYVENTKITLVPGSVIVMGGLKEASVVKFEDKVPVLGDLPFVGRLFRSEGERKKRKALIYFAKVDVIDPTGRDVVTGERPYMSTDN